MRPSARSPPGRRSSSTGRAPQPRADRGGTRGRVSKSALPSIDQQERDRHEERPMDVDASERRPDGRRRRSHEARRGRRHARRADASPAADRRYPVMKTPTGLYTIQEPEAGADSNVFQINAIRSYEHGLVTPRPLGAP